MNRLPGEIDLLDDEVFDAPRYLSPADALAEGGPGWRRCDEARTDREDER